MKKTYIRLRIPIEGQKKPLIVSHFLSDEELDLLTELHNSGMTEWDAFQKMRETYPVSLLL